MLRISGQPKISQGEKAPFPSFRATVALVARRLLSDTQRPFCSRSVTGPGSIW